MSKLTPEAIKFIVHARNNEQFSYEKIRKELLAKFNITVSCGSIYHCYMAHRYDDYVDAGIIAPKPSPTTTKLTPEAIKFIVHARNNEQLSFGLIKAAILTKFGISITTSTVRNRYLQHRYDDIIKNQNLQ